MLCLIPTALFFSYAFFICEVLLAQQITHQYPSNEQIIAMSLAPIIGSVAGGFMGYVLSGFGKNYGGWTGLTSWLFIIPGCLTGLIITPLLTISYFAAMQESINNHYPSSIVILVLFLSIIIGPIVGNFMGYVLYNIRPSHVKLYESAGQEFLYMLLGFLVGMITLPILTNCFMINMQELINYRWSYNQQILLILSVVVLGTSIGGYTGYVLSDVFRRMDRLIYVIWGSGLGIAIPALLIALNCW